MARRASLILLALPMGLVAQAPVVVHSGDYIRLHGANTPGYTVQFAGTRDDSVLYRTCVECEPNAIARSAIDFVELNSQSRRTFGDALAAALLGALVGAGTWVAIDASAERNCHDGPCGIGILFTPIAAGVGALIGIVVDGLSHRARWVPAVLP